MLNHSARRRDGEHGQVLVLAIAFIAFFGIVTLAVLNYGGLTGLQHVNTEATAANDSVGEGGAAWAAADAASGGPLCVAGETGQVTMVGGHSATYTINACDPGTTSSAGSTPCLICVLNQFGSPSTVVLTTSHAGLTVTDGDIFVNGSISGTVTATATAPNTAHIGLLTGASTAGCTCAPAPIKYLAAITDPLSGDGAPSSVAGKPTGCSGADWNAATGCSMSIGANSTATVNPGLWASLSVSGNASVTMNAGTYVFSGPLGVSGNGTLDGSSGVTVYLACASYGPSGQACPASGSSGRTGGSVSFSGNGSVTVQAPTTGQSPQYGPDSIALLADPHLLDPSGTGSCVGGGTCLYNVSGNGSSISGTIDLRSGGMVISGNGNGSIGGRIVTNSLSMSGNGVLNPAGTITKTPCRVYEDSVSGAAGPSPAAVVQYKCGTALATGVVSFSYLP